MVELPMGFAFSAGLHPAYELMRKGTFEVKETEIIRRLSSDCDVFVDVGANVGYYTCIARKAGMHVLSFEPQQLNLDCLLTNLTTNGWDSGVEVFPIALGDKAGLVNLFGASGPSASLLKNWAGYSSSFVQTIPINTLDHILNGRFEDEQLLVKVDVEGAEYRVLSGSVKTLARKRKPVWLMEVCLDEFHPSGANPHYLEIFELFWSHGYESCLVDRFPLPLDREEVREWARLGKSPAGSFDYVFIDGGYLINFADHEGTGHLRVDV
jgi:FkbM family methyltransferase